MKERQAVRIIDTIPPFSAAPPCIGTIVGSNGQGDILVEYEHHAPKPAKLVASMNRNELSKEELRGRQVLLLFEKENPDLPIIVAFMEDQPKNLVALRLPNEKNSLIHEVLIAGKRLTIEAEDEVLIKCGQGSILIRKDGKIIIKGTHLLSRSSGPQRIKGASVNIN